MRTAVQPVPPCSSINVMSGIVRSRQGLEIIESATQPFPFHLKTENKADTFDDCERSPIVRLSGKFHHSLIRSFLADSAVPCALLLHSCFWSFIPSLLTFPEPFSQRSGEVPTCLPFRIEELSMFRFIHGLLRRIHRDGTWPQPGLRSIKPPRLSLEELEDRTVPSASSPITRCWRIGAAAMRPRLASSIKTPARSRTGTCLLPCRRPSAAFGMGPL